MTENRECTCPVCNQRFALENGVTPEEHLAKGILKVCREMQDYPHAGELPCPRCGHQRMKPELHKNTKSRHADIYICEECGTQEAMLAMQNNPLPLIGWHIVSEILVCLPDNNYEDK